MQHNLAATAQENLNPSNDVPWKDPTYVFVYGTLMDPDILRSILRVSALPLLQTATLSGFRLKSWGPYPVLVPSDRPETPNDDVVEGIAFKIDSCEQFERLERYETKIYGWTFCDVDIDAENEDGGSSRISNARAFQWAGDPESRDLKEMDVPQGDVGSGKGRMRFDLERWQRHFKPSVMGR